jgi:hypothetical protein
VGLNEVGQLYEAVLGLGLCAAIAAFVGMALGYAGAFGVFRSRSILTLTLSLTLVSFLLAVMLPVLVALAQPPALSADSSSLGSSCAGGSNACSSFWGSSTVNGTTISWGADVGWYLALAAAVLLLVGLIQLLSSRRQPFTRDEIWVASGNPTAPQGYPAQQMPPSYSPVSSTPAQLSDYPPSSTRIVASTPVAAAPTEPNCPRCGNPLTYVAQYSRYYCWTCRAYP